VPQGKLVLAVSLAVVLLFVVRRLMLLFRGGSDMEDLISLKAAGAQIVDVRTEAEYARGHVQGSRNIPLDQFQARIGEIDPQVPVLLCCASGARSGMAKAILEKAGYPKAHNAGPWNRLQ
jgi:rhodanese-related sulfurtransferase